ncbi:D-lactate dehydrogenase [cytochrome] 1, mitochondrial [Diutina catenulata]
MFRARFVQSIRRASTTRPPPSRQWIGYMAAGVTIGAAGVLLLNRPPVAAVIAEKSDLSSLAVNDLTVPKYADEGQFRHAVALMTQVVGEDDVSTDSGELSSHNDSFFATHHPPNPDQQRPSVVLYPETTEEVAKIVAIAHEHRVPVVASSGLTSLEGQMMHTRGPRSVAISFSKHMNEVVAFYPDDLDVVVQPGVGWKELDDWLLDHEEGKHLMFGPDPGIGAAIGGMVSTSASGTNAYRYGTMKEAVVNMTVVLADGSVIRTKQRPRKSSAGYDLTHLFIGAEGTLGIVTEITLKLHVRPVHEYVSIASFPTIKDAAATAQQVISKSGLHPNAIEILNEEMMMFVNHSGTTTKKFEERPTLFFKLGGPSRENVDEQVKIIRDIAKSNHLCSWETSTSAEDNDLLWSARRQGLWSTIDYGRKVLPDPDDVQVWTTDIAVPISRLAQVIDETDADLKVEFPKKVSVMGHIGDGNCHFLIVYNTPEHAKASAAVDRMVARALKYEGTCTGEHGVGVGKRKYLPVEYGEPAMGLMRALKVGLDKRRILNPDKIVTIDPEDDLDAQLDGHKDWGCCQ